MDKLHAPCCTVLVWSPNWVALVNLAGKPNFRHPHDFKLRVFGLLLVFRCARALLFWRSIKSCSAWHNWVGLQPFRRQTGSRRQTIASRQRRHRRNVVQNGATTQLTVTITHTPTPTHTQRTHDTAVEIDLQRSRGVWVTTFNGTIF